MKIRGFVRRIAELVFYFPENVLPRDLRALIDIESSGILSSVKRLTPQASGSAKALDVGAGSRKWRPLLKNRGYEYESCDLEDPFSPMDAGHHDFSGSVENLPIPSSQYEFVICTQVLEHVRDPRAAIREIFRVLQPKGSLVLTTNFMYGLHGSPHDYFRFSRFALVELFEEAGFEIHEMISRGGYFASMSQFFFEAPNDFVNFMFRGTTTPSVEEQFTFSWKRAFAGLFALPVFFILKTLCWTLSGLFRFFDLFSKGDRYATGYAVLAKKRA